MNDKMRGTRNGEYKSKQRD